MKILKQMTSDGHRPNQLTYNIVINGLCKSGDIGTACRLLEDMNKSGHTADVITYSSIIDRHCKDGLIMEASDLLIEMIDKGISPNVVTYTSLIHGICKLGRWEEAKRTLNEMKYRKVELDLCTFNVLINALCKDGMAHVVEEKILKSMIECGQEPNTVTYNTLVDGYCLRGEIENAFGVYEVMILKGCLPDVITYNILIRALSKNKRVDEAMELFDKMIKKGLIPSNRTFSSLMNGMFLADRPRAALSLLNEMQNHHINPDIGTYALLVDSLPKHHCVNETLALFRVICGSGLNNILIYNLLIRGLCSCGKFSAAKKVFCHLSFENMRIDHSTYAAMIDRLCNEKFLLDASDLLQETEERHCSPFGISHNILIQGFLHHNDLLKAKELIPVMATRGFMLNAGTIETLLVLFCKGRLDQSFWDTVVEHR